LRPIKDRATAIFAVCCCDWRRDDEGGVDEQGTEERGADGGCSKSGTPTRGLLIRARTKFNIRTKHLPPRQIPRTKNIFLMGVKVARAIENIGRQ
jgi:hypothetical protein